MVLLHKLGYILFKIPLEQTNPTPLKELKVD